MYWSPPERARLINDDGRRTPGRWALSQVLVWEETAP
jgi:hypothetical protein